MRFLELFIAALETLTRMISCRNPSDQNFSFTQQEITDAVFPLDAAQRRKIFFPTPLR